MGSRLCKGGVADIWVNFQCFIAQWKGQKYFHHLSAFSSQYERQKGVSHEIYPQKRANFFQGTSYFALSVCQGPFFWQDSGSTAYSSLPYPQREWLALVGSSLQHARLAFLYVVPNQTGNSQTLWRPVCWQRNSLHKWFAKLMLVTGCMLTY